jgi:hypothetical protein
MVNFKYSEFAFVLSAFLFIIALPASSCAMFYGLTGLSVSIFMGAGFLFLTSMAWMFCAE